MENKWPVGDLVEALLLGQTRGHSLQGELPVTHLCVSVGYSFPLPQVGQGQLFFRTLNT